MAARLPAATMARRVRWRSGASGVVTCSGFALRSWPTLSSAVVSRPVEIPAASSTAVARNEVVVLPSVPVTPTTPISRLGSPYHQAAATARAAWLRSTTICGLGNPAIGRSTITAAAPWATAAAT